METDSYLNDHWIPPMEQSQAPTIPQHATSNTMSIVYGNSTPNNDKPAATAVNQSQWPTTKFSMPEGSGVRESSKSSRGIECLCKGIGHICPICANGKKPKPIKECRDFQRHIHEHYTRHHCANCNISYSRKETLENHREKCSGSDGSSVRDDLCPKSQKRTLACGCCDSYYPPSKEIASKKIAKHIHDHFKSPGPILWDPNNVIRGLLSSMNCQWSDPFPRSYYTWNSTSGQVQQLQEALEFGSKPPEVLIKAALELSDYDASQHGHIESPRFMVPTGPNLTPGQPIQTSNTSSLPGPLPGPDPTFLAPQTSYPSIGALNYHAGHPPQPYRQPERGHGLENQYSRNTFGMQPASNFSQQSEGQGGASYPPSYSGYPQSASLYAANNLPASQPAWNPNGPTPSSTNWDYPSQASTSAPPSSFARYQDAYDFPNANNLPASQPAWNPNGPTPSSTNWDYPSQASTSAPPSSFARYQDAYDIPNAYDQSPY